MFTIIAAIGKNRELGKNNSLLWNLPADLAFFKQITNHSKIVMGRKTFESLPRRLKDREYIIVTGNRDFNVEYATMINDLDSYIAENKDTDEEIFVIGGASIYEKFLPHTMRMYITEVAREYSDADCYFPVFDKKEWGEYLIDRTCQNRIIFDHVMFERV